MLRILILTLAFGAGTNRLAHARCEDRDVSDRMGPVRSQGAKGWCFAFTAADLVGFKLGITPTEQISALDLASANYFATGESAAERLGERIQAMPDGPAKDAMMARREMLENPEKPGCIPVLRAAGGSVQGALTNYQIRAGYCTETTLPSGPNAEGTKWAIDYLDQQLRLLIDDYADFMEVNSQVCTQRTRDFEMGGLENTDLWCAINGAAAISVEEQIGRLCVERPRLPTLNFTTVTQTQHGLDAMIQALDEALDNDIPVGMGYDACFLVRNDCSAETIYNHASSIVGRRAGSKGQCEYKIRNSWGANCDAYWGRFKDSCEANPGYIWVKESDLRRWARDFTHII